jgi:protein transport protein SEC23
VQCSRELRVSGAIGHMASLNKKSNLVGETEIGISGTTAWKICALDTTSSYAVFFEVAGAQQQGGQSRGGVIQFLTHYQNSTGQRYLRVTTISRAWADPTQGNAPLIAGFDQEAAAVLMARIGVFKADVEESFDVLRWVDRMLIRVCSKFGEYRKDDPSSFQLPQGLVLYPQFMFYLRRSQFLQVFNSSPDESTFLRYMLNRETVTNSLIMIQPTLEAYSFDGPPQAVLLSATSIVENHILLLDTFFHVVIFHGSEIARWKREGYAEDPAQEHFRQLLQAPKDDATLILKDRFPLPRFIDCDQGSSQARFLLATLDPSVTHQSYGGGTASKELFTDSVSLQVFMDHLKKLSVTAQ